MQRGQEIPKTDHPTVFYEVLQSSLPPEEKSLQRMGDEAQTIIGAGLETTAWALSIASYHIIANPLILRTLRAELSTVLPTPSSAPRAADWLTLEKLPYLTACITESVRLSYGISHRNPRVSHAPLKYKDWTIPAGVPVGMNVVDVQHDEAVFPDSHAFVPERWLGGPKAASGKPLSRYFVAFGKDARSCLGIK
jgi:cytochrome P450